MGNPGTIRSDRGQFGPGLRRSFSLFGDLTLARRQSGLPHDEALDPRHDDH
jgi:hypothetical protein